MLSQEYIKNPRMSQSKLKKILDGIEEFKYALDNPPEESEAMRLGTAVHLLLLQPDKSKLIVESPKFDGRTWQGKAWKKLLEGETIFEYNREEEKQFVTDMMVKYWGILGNQNEYILLSSEMYQKAHAMADSVRKNSDAMQILNSCEEFEKENYFNYSGIEFKSQLDGIGANFILDLKTTRCENKEYKIKNEIINSGYHFQAATYLAGTGLENYFIIFVRNEPPYSVFPVKLSQEMLDEGRYLLEDACKTYKDCLINNPEFKPNNKLRII